MRRAANPTVLAKTPAATIRASPPAITDVVCNGHLPEANIAEQEDPMDELSDGQADQADLRRTLIVLNEKRLGSREDQKAGGQQQRYVLNQGQDGKQSNGDGARTRLACGWRPIDKKQRQKGRDDGKQHRGRIAASQSHIRTAVCDYVPVRFFRPSQNEILGGQCCAHPVIKTQATAMRQSAWPTPAGDQDKCRKQGRRIAGSPEDLDVAVLDAVVPDIKGRPDGQQSQTGDGKPLARAFRPNRGFERQMTTSDSIAVAAQKPVTTSVGTCQDAAKEGSRSTR